mmetsp:Transcript_21650/g.60174  ORF Transcript_21650/g.60174 Transcript_21650/m.60174 type:complete len:95 (-) Transcript_21650:12-296(-)
MASDADRLLLTLSSEGRHCRGEEAHGKAAAGLMRGSALLPGLAVELGNERVRLRPTAIFRTGTRQEAAIPIWPDTTPQQKDCGCGANDSSRWHW